MRLFLKYFTLISILCLPQTAFSHSPIKGIGDFLNGVLHPLLVPEQVIIIFGLGLWYGQHQPNQHKKSIIAFMLAVIIGLLLGDFFNDWDKTLWLLIISLIMSLFVVTRLGINKPFYLLISFSLLSGFLLGLDSAQEGLVGKAKLLMLFGSGVGIYFFTLYAMAFSESFSQQAWRIILVRIVASWLSASALMVLALRFS